MACLVRQSSIGTGNDTPLPPLPSDEDDDEEEEEEASNWTDDRSGTIRFNAGMVVFAKACPSIVAYPTGYSRPTKERYSW